MKCSPRFTIPDGDLDESYGLRFDCIRELFLEGGSDCYTRCRHRGGKQEQEEDKRPLVTLSDATNHMHGYTECTLPGLSRELSSSLIPITSSHWRLTVKTTFSCPFEPPNSIHCCLTPKLESSIKRNCVPSRFGEGTHTI